MCGVTDVHHMMVRADAFQQFLSGWSLFELWCLFEYNADDHRIRVAGIDLAWYPSHNDRKVDQWLRAHDMVVLLRRSFYQTILWRKLPEELAHMVGYWLGLNITKCNP
jgi:hypothetical protein